MSRRADRSHSSSKVAPGQRPGRGAVEVLSGAFEAAGWSITRPRPSSGSPDLLCRKGNSAYAVEVKEFAGPSRRANLQALLADAILRARVHAQALGAQPLAVLVASSLSDRIAAELGAYARDFGEGVAWGLLDDSGRFDLHGPGIESVAVSGKTRTLERRTPGRQRFRRAVHNPFSDLGQWLLKVLLAPNVPQGWLTAPRGHHRSITELADAAGVSMAVASRFVSALESEGYLAKDDDGVRVLRGESLLDAWRIAAHVPGDDLPARFLLPTQDPRGRLRDMLAARHRAGGNGQGGTDEAGRQAGPRGERSCLALFAACGELGVGHVSGAPVHLYAESLSQEFLESLQLHPVDRRSDADVTIRRPLFPESVFRGCVMVRDVAVADIFQCWLDVSFHPARGAEQAAEILKRLDIDAWPR